uniref:Uncharacterized protein n=1 Tax=Malus domestica TaxID=3750 RepID=E4Z8K7_MALDO|nr:hypothetical protein [Malus domestica]
MNLQDDQACPTSIARQALPDATCPTKPDSEAEARQQPSTSTNLPGSCVLVGQETSPTEIPDANTFFSPFIYFN